MLTLVSARISDVGTLNSRAPVKVLLMSFKLPLLAFFLVKSKDTARLAFPLLFAFKNSQTARACKWPRSAFFPAHVVRSQGFPPRAEKQTRSGPISSSFPAQPSSPTLAENTENVTSSSASQVIVALCVLRVLDVVLLNWFWQ